MYLVELILPVPLFQTFSYLSEEPLLAGQRVVAPFRSSKLIGIVKSCKKVKDKEELPPFELKYVQDVLDKEPIVPENLMKFLEWVASYYLSPLGTVYKIALPPQSFVFPKRKVKLTKEGKEALDKGLLPEKLSFLKKGAYTIKHVVKKTGLSEKRLKELEKEGFIVFETEVPKVKVPTEKFIKIEEEAASLSSEEKEVVDFVKACGEVLESVLKKRFLPEVIKGLITKGILQVVELPRTRRLSFSVEVPEDYRLTPSQRGVWKRLEELLDKGGFCPVLLFGVTGSGKSFIYLEAIKKVLASGRKVLVLVPEIALTTYMESLLLHYFKENLALLHSGLSPRERFGQWWKILRGEASIIIGTRSAIFAPVKNLGLIVVDEEHDPSYKEEGLSCRYHARDLALKRAKDEGIPIILGSATPSVKSFYLAQKGKYHLLTLKERPFVSLPEVKIVEHKPFKLFSKKVKEEIEKVLKRGKSVFLYLNRRGYAPLVKCGECDYVWECPNCGIPLTYHKEDNALLCHYCGFEVKGFKVCPACKGTRIKLLRAGTQRIEEAVKEEFPGVEVFRLDRDAVSTEKKLLQILEKLYENKPKIIIGTQMGVHGHNFPEVHLVGILRAEEGMFLPYYKAGERTFQLLVQACGRAGRRGEKGKVILQTAFPDHYVIKYAVSQDYEGFFKKELELRRVHNFPPFSRLALIRVEGNKEERVKEFIKEVYGYIERMKAEEVEVLGPSPCPLKKLKGTYRWHLLLRSKSYPPLAGVLKKVISAFEKPPLKLIFNLDPEEIL